MNLRLLVVISMILMIITAGCNKDNITEKPQPPKANAGVDGTYKEGTKVILSADKSTDDGQIVSYEWKESGKILSLKKEFSISTLSLGKHTIVLKVIDNDGLTSTDSVEITIISKDTPLPLSVKAFPSAEGYGSVTGGGRKGKVYKVTTLNWDGEGSLKQALYAKEPRIIVFEVSGVIHIPEWETPLLTHENSYVTVAGQTSPGGITLRMIGEGSIGLRSYNLTEATPPKPLAEDKQFHDAIFRNIRFRGNGNTDNVSLAGVHHIIFDHCDFSGALDEALDITHSHDVTIQYCTVTNTQGQYGFLLAYNPTTNISLHHNLSANLEDRCGAHIHWEISGTPEGGAKLDIRDNYGYNCWHESFYPISLKDGDVMEMNFVENYFEVGPNSAGPGKSHSTTGMISFWYEPSYINQSATLYANGNMFPDTDKVNFPSGQRPLFPMGGNHVILADLPYNSPKVTTQKAEEAREIVLKKAGAFPRDAMNLRVLNEIKTKTGSLHNINDVLLEKYVAAPIDSDNDGMADEWEKANGLEVGVNDSADDKNGNGYTNIEDYINELMNSLLK